MKVIGLTGGIGSGKTTVANMFRELGVPVYIADEEAKRLMNVSKVIKRKLIGLLGERAYEKGKINRPYIAEKIFTNSLLLDEVNKIIHPKVASHFKRWLKKQQGEYCIKEAAILFENGGYQQCDLTILVTSPLKERIKRVMARDGTTRKAIEDRIKNQWSDDKKSKLADIVIENIKFETTEKQVKKIHYSLS